MSQAAFLYVGDLNRVNPQQLLLLKWLSAATEFSPEFFTQC